MKKNSYLSYFLMYTFYYLAWALFSTLISVYLLDLGYLASDVSLVTSASYLSSMIVQPFVGSLADRFGTRKVNIVLFILSAIGGILFIFAHDLLWIAIGYSFVLTLINSSNPTMEKIATSSPYPYGKIRIWGTIGYAFGSQLAGLIYDSISPTALFITFSITFVIAVVGTYYTDPKETVQEKGEKTSISTLLKNKKYLYFLLISAIFTGMANIGHTYIAPMLQNAGLSISFVSTILMIAVLCEMPLVLFSNKFMDKISSKNLMLIAFDMLIIQFLSYGLNAWMPIQILTTLMSKHPSGMLFIMINLKVISNIVDEHQQVTALAFCATIKSLAMVICNMIAGNMLDHISYANTFMICLVPLLIGLVLVILFKLPEEKNQNLFS